MYNDLSGLNESPFRKVSHARHLNAMSGHSDINPG